MGCTDMAGMGNIGARALRMALLGLMMVVIAACSPVYRNHGYVPNEDELSQIEVGKDTRETLAPLIGRPSAAALLNDEGWYYVQSRWKYAGARAPKEIDRQVVAITFTEDGVVENVERFGLENGKVVALSRRVTASNIKGIGFIRQLLGSVGNLSAGDFLGNGPAGQ
jgi:outer membrane protein assembly factor BamE (lipoprotein component of BamABCDE complex)